MRFIVIFLLICIPIESYSISLREILSKSELDSVLNGFEISKFTKCFDDLKNFEGRLKIKLIDNRLICCTIGEWKSFYKDTKILKAYFKFDSLGCLENYKEYSQTGFINYDCVYEKKNTGNINYLIETIRSYYDNGQLFETGQRAEKFVYKNRYFHRLNSFKKIGLWTRYYYDGTLKNKKQHKELKK